MGLLRAKCGLLLMFCVACSPGAASGGNLGQLQKDTGVTWQAVSNNQWAPRPSSFRAALRLSLSRPARLPALRRWRSS
jgi:hypothetical protein